jgi:hypothetical protein
MHRQRLSGTLCEKNLRWNLICENYYSTIMKLDRTSIVFVGTLFLLGLSVYWDALHSGFLSDDYDVLETVSGKHSLYAWVGCGAVGFLRPVVTASFYLDWLIWGMNPLGFHFFNVLIHVLNAILVMQILKYLMMLSCVEKANRLAPATAALIFLILPCHTESVSWISGRGDVVATFFVSSSILCYLMAYKEKVQEFVGLSLAFFTLGLFSKENCIAIPILIIVVNLGIAFCNKNFCKDDRRLELLPLSTIAYFLIILIIYLAVRKLVVGEFIGGYGFSAHASFDVDKITFYAGRKLTKLFVPLDIIVWLDVPRYGILLRLLGSIAAALSVGAIMAYAAVGVRPGKNRSTERLLRTFSNNAHILIITFCCMMACFLGTLNLGIALDSTEADRHVYLASVFGAMMLAVIMAALLRRTRKAWIVLIVIIIGYVGSLLTINSNWRTAGEISTRVFKVLRDEISATPVIITNLPDNLHGAYIWRNGLVSALRLLGEKTASNPHVVVASWQNLVSPHDKTFVTGHQDYHRIQFDSGIFFLNSRPSDDSNQRYSHRDARLPRHDFFEIVDLGPNSFGIRFCLQQDPEPIVFYYSAGRLHGLKPHE